MLGLSLSKVLVLALIARCRLTRRLARMSADRRCTFNGGTGTSMDFNVASG